MKFEKNDALNYNTIKPLEIVSETLEYNGKQVENLFTRMPNCAIQTNIKSEYGVSNIFLLVYHMIDRHRDITNTSYIIPGDILKMLGYKLLPHKPTIFYEIINSLICLKISNYIDFDLSEEDLCKASYSTCIKIYIIEQHFDKNGNFTKLFYSDVDKLLLIHDSTIKKENLLNVFLYVSSCIYKRPKDENNKEIMYNPETKPEVFYKNITLLAPKIGMSRATIFSCLDVLVKHELLKKKEMNNNFRYSNLYALNKPGYEQELEWAAQKIQKEFRYLDKSDLIFGQN